MRDVVCFFTLAACAPTTRAQAVALVSHPLCAPFGTPPYTALGPFSVASLLRCVWSFVGGGGALEGLLFVTHPNSRCAVSSTRAPPPLPPPSKDVTTPGCVHAVLTGR